MRGQSGWGGGQGGGQRWAAAAATVVVVVVVVFVCSLSVLPATLDFINFITFCSYLTEKHQTCGSGLDKESHINDVEVWI